MICLKDFDELVCIGLGDYYIINNNSNIYCPHINCSRIIENSMIEKFLPTKVLYLCYNCNTETYKYEINIACRHLCIKSIKSKKYFCQNVKNLFLQKISKILKVSIRNIFQTICLIYRKAKKIILVI